MKLEHWEYMQKHKAVRAADMGRDFGHTRQWAQQVLSLAVWKGELVRGAGKTYCLPDASDVKVPLAPRPNKKAALLVERLKELNDWTMSRDLLAATGVSINTLMTALEKGMVIRQGINWYGLPGWPDLPIERQSSVQQCLAWLRDTGPKTPAEMYGWWKGRASQASVVLHRMRARGLVCKVNGKYQLTQ